MPTRECGTRRPACPTARAGSRRRQDPGALRRWCRRRPTNGPHGRCRRRPRACRDPRRRPDRGCSSASAAGLRVCQLRHDNLRATRRSNRSRPRCRHAPASVDPDQRTDRRLHRGDERPDITNARRRPTRATANGPGRARGHQRRERGNRRRRAAPDGPTERAGRDLGRRTRARRPGCDRGWRPLLRSLRAALQPIDTWSSCIADVGIDSTLAGAARRRFSATIAACVYCTIISPELTPASSTRNGGSPCDRVGSSSRSVRRSAIDPTSAAAMARKSHCRATGAPWKWPHDSTRPSGNTVGLSIADRSSMSAVATAFAAASRAAPCTCGVHRNE